LAKIWEVDFTKFDPPSSANAVDNIGTENITSDTNIVKGLLPGFTYRPGVIFDQDNGIVSTYTLTTGSNPSALFAGNYSQRSFVIWYYAIGDGPWENRSTLWGHQYGYSNPREGWTMYSSSLILRADYNTVATYPISFTETAGWKLLVCLMDKSTGTCRGIGRSLAEDYDSGSQPFVSASSPQEAAVGDDNSSREISASIGYMATYDHILSIAEIDAIEDAFLRDSINGETSVAELQGIVVDEGFNIVPSADVTLFNNDLNILVAHDTTTTSGTYSIDIPYYGNYTVTASHPPNTGAIALPFTVSGSGGSPGVITFYGGS